MPESHYLRAVLLALAIAASVLTQTLTFISAFIAGATTKATDVNDTTGVESGASVSTPLTSNVDSRGAPKLPELSLLLFVFIRQAMSSVDQTPESAAKITRLRGGVLGRA